HLSDIQNAGDPDRLAAALASLTPVAARIDRDRLMFLAGQASTTASSVASGGCQAPGTLAASSNPITGKLTHPARLAWPASTAVLAATALTLAIMLWLRPAARIEIVYVQRPASSSPSDMPRQPR